MNERIRQLARQAQVGSAEFGNGISYFVSTEETFNKFAELIVQECVGILEPKSRYMGEGPEVLKDKIRQIKKHFGVEE
jgi:hypothetical protein